MANQAIMNIEVLRYNPEADKEPYLRTTKFLMTVKHLY